MVPEASNGFKLMFFHALVIQGPSQIDSGSIWEKSFFDENFQNFEPYDEAYSHKNLYVYQRSGQSESTQNLKQLKIQKPNEAYQILTDRC